VTGPGPPGRAAGTASDETGICGSQQRRAGPVFLIHRLASGALRVRPRRQPHTYGSGLAAGIDLLTLRELMGQANPETTAGRAPVTGDADGRVRPGQGGGPPSAPAVVTLRRPGAPDLLVGYAGAVAALPIGPDGRQIRRTARRMAAGLAAADGRVDEAADSGATFTRSGPPGIPATCSRSPR
jgi:hypothetical protein